ncbi:R-spondin-2 [Bulinus truncatus]|nr:R-spondin-2 [Bulinus truncatus]
MDTVILARLALNNRDRRIILRETVATQFAPGAAACSPINGCVSCESHLFMFLHRQNMREVGICTPSCPVGFYGVRHQYYNKCYRCHIDHCYSCFSRQYCTLCEEPYLVNEGRCIEQCPAGQYYANFTRECKDRVDCLPGAWSPWTECSRNGQNCGFKNGNQVRTRSILQDASPNGTPCPEVTETQRCRLPHRHCDGGCGSRRTNLQRKKNKWIERRRKKKKKKPKKKKMRGRGIRRGDGGIRKKAGHRRDNEKFNQQALPGRACRVCGRSCRRKRVRKFSSSG